MVDLEDVAEVELVDDLKVARDGDPLEVDQEAATLVHQEINVTAGVKVLAVFLQMLREPVDLGRYDGHY